MQAYFTPVKEHSPNASKLPKTSTQPREGDWVCWNCNNLNFSFRKKCNRCKTQTRQQNESNALYYLNYYSKSYYAQMPSAPCRNGSHAPTSADSQPPHTPTDSHSHKTPEKIQKDLPSVSPLLKKYNARDTTPVSDCSSPPSVWGVSVRDFEDVLGSSGRSEGSEGRGEENLSSDDLERMINRIML